MTEHICSCAKCQGIEPWASMFAQCIQRGWMIANQAISDGIASDVTCDIPHN